MFGRKTGVTISYPLPHRVFILLSSASSTQGEKEKREIQQTQLSPEGIHTSSVAHPLTLHPLFHVITVRQGLLPAPQ